MPGEHDGKAKLGSVPPPKCKAILLCEKTIVEKDTGRISLINVFTSVTLDPVPGSMPEFKVFLQFSGGIGQQDLRLEIRDLEEDLVHARSKEVPLNWSDRVASFNVILSFPSVQINHVGVYDAVVFVGNEEVERQRFRVKGPENP